MRVQTITNYISDDGITFSEREQAVDREQALILKQNVEDAQRILDEFQKRCNHGLVKMQDRHGDWSDKFKITCLCCTRVWTESRTDLYWRDRYDSNEGLYWEDT